jgi:hypothetical protein
VVDPSRVQVDVSLPETDVARIRVGQPVEMTFEAVPGPRFPGKVIAIAPAATVQSGVSTYLVSLSVEEVIRQQTTASETGTSSGSGTGVPGSGMGRSSSGATAGSGTPVDVSALKPGMTALANIVYAQKDDVLTVPNRAIRLQGQERVIDVIIDGDQETRIVKVGMSSDLVTEIIEGLAEGDTVVIPTTSTVSANVPIVPGTTGGGGGPGRTGGLPR